MSEDSLRNPFVLQCKACGNILTDSFSLLDYRNGYLIHSFSTAKEETRIQSGREGPFEKCLVQKVKCLCNTPVGVFLSSTSEEFNGLSSTYAFDKAASKSYQLGSCVSKEKGLCEIVEDVEKLKTVVSKIYKKVYQ